MDVTKFTYTENSIYFIWLLVKSWLFKQLTRNSTNLFLRGQDIISISPQISGNHEIITTKLIESFAQNGYDDFLVDIGANIGLISCQTGQKFKEIHMYEPNPICCCVLEANSLISLNDKKFMINKFGLGEEDGYSKLNVPKNNWGGAYIQKQNYYNLDIIFGKDGFRNFDSQNYLEIQILVKSAKNNLSELFSQFLDKNLRYGVIKIDVEGYEPVMLKGIADALPEDMKVQIVFESLDPGFELNNVLEKFGDRCVTVYTLTENFPWNKHRVKLPNIVKGIFILFKLNVKTVLRKLSVGESRKGTLVIQVD